MLHLVDSGADNSIFPSSVARNPGIETTPGTGPGATAFGGQQIALAFADVVLELSDQEGTTVRWRARVHFADFATESTVILGHEGFLDNFTTTFFGGDCVSGAGVHQLKLAAKGESAEADKGDLVVQEFEPFGQTGRRVESARAVIAIVGGLDSLRFDTGVRSAQGQSDALSARKEKPVRKAAGPAHRDSTLRSGPKRGRYRQSASADSLFATSF